MKNYLIILILVLCLTCWLGGINMPPSPLATGINKIPASSFGVNHQEGMIPDFTFTDDKERGSAYITTIDENSRGDEVEFPMGIR